MRKRITSIFFVLISVFSICCFADSTAMAKTRNESGDEVLLPLNGEGGDPLFDEGDEPVKVLRIDSIKYPWPSDGVKPYGDFLSVRYWKVISASRKIEWVEAMIDTPISEANYDTKYSSTLSKINQKSIQLGTSIDGDMEFSKLEPSRKSFYRFIVHVKLQGDDNVYWFCKEFSVAR